MKQNAMVSLPSPQVSLPTPYNLIWPCRPDLCLSMSNPAGLNDKPTAASLITHDARLSARSILHVSGADSYEHIGWNPQSRWFLQDLPSPFILRVCDGS